MLFFSVFLRLNASKISTCDFSFNRLLCTKKHTQENTKTQHQVRKVLNFSFFKLFKREKNVIHNSIFKIHTNSYSTLWLPVHKLESSKFVGMVQKLLTKNIVSLTLVHCSIKMLFGVMLL